MAPPNDFIVYLLELLEPMGPVTAKRMFGGYGLFLNGLMFAIVVDEVLYLKVDDTNRKDFEAQDLPPFTYQKKDKEVALSFYQAPPDALEDSEMLCEWSEQAFKVAKRAKKK